MDFMNLNQAAHGDREYAYIQTRLGVSRTTVVGHVSNPLSRAGSARGCVVRPVGLRRTSCVSRASATTCATSR